MTTLFLSTKGIGTTSSLRQSNLTQQQHEYDTYKDLGHQRCASIPEGYKKIRAHFVFDIKHDGRHKARLAADGHLTEVPLSSAYSGVVSLQGIRLVLFLSELNGLQAWGTDIGNACLEAFTKEKVHIIAGPEFGNQQDHILIILKALYGLRTSGLRWHERLADCLRDMGYAPCKISLLSGFKIARITASTSQFMQMIF